MLLVMWVRVKAEFKAQFKTSRVLVQKFLCSFWKCCYTHGPYYLY